MRISEVGGDFKTVVTPGIGLKSWIKITLDVIWVPFDDRFGGVIERFKEHSKYLNECAKVASFKTDRERYEELKRGLELLRICRELEERATTDIRERMGELNDVLRGKIESEKKAHSGS